MAVRKKTKVTKSRNAQLTPDGILQLGLAFMGSRTLLTAIELGVFTELAKGPVEAKVLRQRLGLHERSARDFFDALVALGMLRRKKTTYRTRPRRRCSSTGTSRRTSAEFWRWPGHGSTDSGAR